MLIARVLLSGVLLVIVSGCASGPRPATMPVNAALMAQTRPSTNPATQPALTFRVWNDVTHAYVAPPTGWIEQPAKHRAGADDVLWLSPTGATAYGVMMVQNLLIAFASDDRVLGEILKNTQATEGSAEMLEKKRDPTLAGGIGGVRFLMKGGKYTVRGNLVSSGTHVWIWYAGTLTGQPVNQDELDIAINAREQTIVEPAIGRMK
jgi:hypothetical protein